MKFWKICIIMFGVLILILSSTSVSAVTETDSTGDVYNAKMVDSQWTYQPSVDSKPNIDITELTYTISGNQLTISMKVSGNIQISENVAYMAWVNTSDATYNMYLVNNQKFVMAMSIEGGGMPVMNTDVTVSGDTISGTVELIGSDDTSDEFWGYAMEYEEIGPTNQEWWGDWIPGDYAPFWGEEGDGDDDGEGEGDGNGDTNGEGDTNGDSGGNGGNGSGTPGFEVLAVITALAIAIIILRRRK